MISRAVFRLAMVTAVAAPAIGCWNWSTEKRLAAAPTAIATAAVAPAAPAAPGPFPKAGFVTAMEGDRLWVFREGSADLMSFRTTGELAKHTTQVGVGPAGLTLKAPDKATIVEYLAAKPGFEVTTDGDGRLWVFRAGSPAGVAVAAGAEPEKHVTRVNAGPLGTTLKSVDTETLDEYLATKPGFVTHVVDGRLWVFYAASKELEIFEAGGELAKHVTRVGVGPGGMTVKSPDDETIVDYVASQEGFETFVNVDGRLWVFRLDSPALDQFYRTGAPEKHITLVGAGPMGMTIKSRDRETADAYLRVCAHAR